MSAQVQTQPVGGSFTGRTVIAVTAFFVGVVATIAISTTFDDATPAVSSANVAEWDAGKLEAMQGRQLAETVTAGFAWDAAKLEAMQGRQLAETVTAGFAWDAAKLEAMQGRQLAEVQSATRTGDGPIVWDSWMSDERYLSTLQQQL